MNALASDQAKRIAELVDGSEELKSAGIRVGMYVGGQEHSSVKMMLPDKVITDHETLLAAPPDILMTNYKMLDYLDRKSTRLNSSHTDSSRMPSSA